MGAMAVLVWFAMKLLMDAEDALEEPGNKTFSVRSSSSSSIHNTASPPSPPSSVHPNGFASGLIDPPRDVEENPLSKYDPIDLTYSEYEQSDPNLKLLAQTAIVHKVMVYGQHDMEHDPYSHLARMAYDTKGVIVS